MWFPSLRSLGLQYRGLNMPNTFDKSTNKPIVCFLSFNKSKLLSTKSTNAWSMEWSALNSWCFLFNIVFFQKASTIYYTWPSLIFLRGMGVRILAYRLLLALSYQLWRLVWAWQFSFFSRNDPLSMEFLNMCIKGFFILLYTDIITFTCNSSKHGLFKDWNACRSSLSVNSAPFRIVLIPGKNIWNAFVLFGRTNTSFDPISTNKSWRNHHTINDFWRSQLFFS